MAQIKGFAILGLFHFAKERGISSSDLVASLPGELRPVFAKPIVHGDFYPYEAFCAVLRKIEERLGRGDGRLMREVGRAAAREDVKGIFRVVSFITSPETAVGRAGVFWHRYADTGKLSKLELRHGFFRMAMEDFPEIDPLHCRLMEGWIEGLGEIWRTKNVAVRQTECVRAGATRCVFEASWE